MLYYVVLNYSIWSGACDEDTRLQQLQHKINRTHPICVPSVNDKETGSRLCHWSPLADALGSNDPKSGGEWWAILDKLAAEDPGCGAAIGCLVGLALGDACGAPLEFCAVDSRLPDLPAGDFSDLRRPCLSAQLDETGQLVYQNARNKFDLKLGQWTDDASMALCLADSLLVRGRYDGGDVRVRWHMWWFHGYCNAFRYDAERRKGRGSVGLGGNVAKSLQEIERSVQIAQSSGRLQKNASHASVVPPIYQSSSNDSGNGCLACARACSRSCSSPVVVGSYPRACLTMVVIRRGTAALALPSQGGLPGSMGNNSARVARYSQ
ncbi:tri1 [Symbiodinium sp. CCMP2592]|nr:tri1 [Symbiodinium sp. CCMP2592]